MFAPNAKGSDVMQSAFGCNSKNYVSILFHSPGFQELARLLAAALVQLLRSRTGNNFPRKHALNTLQYHICTTSRGHTKGPQAVRLTWPPPWRARGGTSRSRGSWRARAAQRRQPTGRPFPFPVPNATRTVITGPPP